jgi:hypothetical protein
LAEVARHPRDEHKQRAWACGGIGYYGGGLIADAFFERMKDKLLARVGYVKCWWRAAA